MIGRQCCDVADDGCVLTADGMLCSRRMMLVFVVGLLFGYTLMYVIVRSLYSQSNAGVFYFVPSAPHSHAEINHYVPSLRDVQQWHDFDESSHISSSTFTFIPKFSKSSCI